MAITRVRIQINGTWTELSSSDGINWSGNAVAPGTSSYNLPGHYYPVTLEATNSNGETVTISSTDADYGEILRLFVKEVTNPVISFISPAVNVGVIHNLEPLEFSVVDESGGSGVYLNSIEFDLDGTVYTPANDAITYTTITNGYKLTFTPPKPYSEGNHVITINASDYDGNEAEELIRELWVNPWFVYDRTQEDINKAKELRTLGYDELTDEEKAEWNAGLKGCLNTVDLQRIENAVYIIDGLLNTQVTSYRNNLPEYPFDTYLSGLLTRAATLLAVGYRYSTTPSMPAMPMNTYPKWNDLELILHDIHEVYNQNFYRFAGESFYAGDGIGLLL